MLSLVPYRGRAEHHAYIYVQLIGRLYSCTYYLLMAFTLIKSLAHQPFEKLGEVPYETSVKKCVTVDVSHIIFWR